MDVQNELVVYVNRRIVGDKMWSEKKYMPLPFMDNYERYKLFSDHTSYCKNNNVTFALYHIVEKYHPTFDMNSSLHIIGH